MRRSRVTSTGPKVIAWELTRRCALRCQHCRGSARDEQYAGELSTEECRRVIDGIAEIAIEKGTSTLLIPVSARKQLFDLSDDMATKINIQFYNDPRDALLKALEE